MSRVQLALRVSDLEALDRVLLVVVRGGACQAPPRLRANFSVAEPPLKLVLIEGEPDQARRHR